MEILLDASLNPPLAALLSCPSKLWPVAKEPSADEFVI
jgi:hypothetical protein